MIVLKKSTASLTILSLGVHIKVLDGSSHDYEPLHKIHPFISILQEELLKKFMDFPKNERRQITDVSLIRKRDIHESTYRCCSELCKCSGKDLSVL